MGHGPYAQHFKKKHKKNHRGHFCVFGAGWPMGHRPYAWHFGIKHKKMTEVIFVLLVLDGPWAMAHTQSTSEANIQK
jgi:hypothetical protein